MRGPDGKVVVRGFSPSPVEPRRLLRPEFVTVEGFRVGRFAEAAPESTGLRVLQGGGSDQRTSTLMEVAA